jgi:diguanylate cyclase (GGDEF)-like protein
MAEPDQERMDQAVAAQMALRELQRRLERLERREWFTWWSVVVVMLLLLVAVVTVSFPDILRERNPLERFYSAQTLRALIAVVLIFNVYTIWQQMQIRKLRHELAARISEVARLQVQADEFYNLAVMDHLTGLFNRRFADERLATEVARARRHRHALTLVTLDLDDFKAVNDRHGHAAGDLVLRQFAARLKKAIRTTDVAARMGGDEFLAMLIECPEARAHILVNRLRPFEIDLGGEKVTLNVSAGWAGYQEGEASEKLLERADRSLYENKRAAKSGKVPSPRG